MTRSPALRRLAPLGIGAALVLMLSGCFGAAAPEPTPTEAPVTTAPTEAAAPAAPALVPEGTAEDNLPFFTSIVQTVAGGPESVAGKAYIDALVAGGFDKSAMQVTEDVSTVGNPAESIQFSVRWGEQCLVGQVGPATGAPVAVVMDGLDTGGCLIGSTRPIDW
ncbi:MULTISPECIES: DUF6993 domain-containing protein [unclassified Microbacterium]|uniref:DUF6993 domain-containing protein n=1 Tax=unclassified Microbacterium TaxID=2609290 RepID=UPI0037450223